MKKFYICSTNACVERMLDCQKISNYFKVNGWQCTAEVSKADTIIINTCSFNKDEDDSSVDYIKYYLKKKAKPAKVIIAGCMSRVNPSLINQFGQFSSVSPTELCKLDEILKLDIKFHEVAEPNSISASGISYKPVFKKLLASITLLSDLLKRQEFGGSFLKECANQLRKTLDYMMLIKSCINPLLVCNRNKFFYIRISKGCLSNCSYCAKRFSTGLVNSKSSKEIIGEFKKGIQAGHRNFFLLSEDVGSYGMENGTTIICLLEEMFLAGKGYDYKIAISNFNARWFVKYYGALGNIISDNQDKILHIQIPIQSGSNKILGLMKRHYKIEDVERCLLFLKKRAPFLNFTTDIIVGFPGETDEDFNMTKGFLGRAKFCYADVFSYTDRPNTIASMMEGKVPPEIIDKRASELLRMPSPNSGIHTLVKKFVELARSVM